MGKEESRFTFENRPARIHCGIIEMVTGYIQPMERKREFCEYAKKTPAYVDSAVSDQHHAIDTACHAGPIIQSAHNAR